MIAAFNMLLHRYASTRHATTRAELGLVTPCRCGKEDGAASANLPCRLERDSDEATLAEKLRIRRNITSADEISGHFVVIIAVCTVVRHAVTSVHFCHHCAAAWRPAAALNSEETMFCECFR